MKKISELEAIKLLGKETVVAFKATLSGDENFGLGLNRKYIVNLTGSGLGAETSFVPNGLGAIIPDESGVVSEQRLQFEVLESFYLEGNALIEGFYSENA